MEKRIFGVILTILGIAGLILAAYNFVQGNTNNNHSIRSLVMYGILGLVFFLCRNRSDPEYQGCYER